MLSSLTSLLRKIVHHVKYATPKVRKIIGGLKLTRNHSSIRHVKVGFPLTRRTPTPSLSLCSNAGRGFSTHLVVVIGLFAVHTSFNRKALAKAFLKVVLEFF